MHYDIEVSGFGSHQSGHLCLLRLTQQIYPGGELLVNHARLIFTYIVEHLQCAHSLHGDLESQPGWNKGSVGYHCDNGPYCAHRKCMEMSVMHGS